MSERLDQALEALARVPLAVAVISAADGANRGCSTGTLTYVSMQPALIAVPLAPTSKTCVMVLRTRELCVSVLGADQADIAVRAGRSAAGQDKFTELEIAVEEPPPGRRAPAVADCLAALWCDVEDARELGDHLLCVCAVRATRVSERGPLVRFRRRYHELGAQITVAGERPYPL
jgi:flavin reductase (DIM6/NTAB) family NADH-FMN oxidoreductase RutF